MAHYLKGRRCRTWSTQNPKKAVYWLNWADANLAETAQSLGGEDDFLRWGMTFTHYGVYVGFYLYQPLGKDREEPSPLDRIKGFMRATPINRQDPDRFRVTDNGFGWWQVYRQKLLSGDDLAEMSGSKTKDEVLRRLTEFMASEESEYQRIEDYFQCLAFRPDGSASRRKGSP